MSFFKEFLEALFPDVPDHIDFHCMKPLRDEVYTDLLKGSTRRLDIVVETSLKGTDVLVIVHVEPQSYKQTDFHKRVYHYFSYSIINTKSRLYLSLFSVMKKTGKRINLRWSFPSFTCVLLII